MFSMMVSDHQIDPLANLTFLPMLISPGSRRRRQPRLFVQEHERGTTVEEKVRNIHEHHK